MKTQLFANSFQLIALREDKWEKGMGFFVRALLAEISPSPVTIRVCKAGEWHF